LCLKIRIKLLHETAFIGSDTLVSEAKITDLMTERVTNSRTKNLEVHLSLSSRKQTASVHSIWFHPTFLHSAGVAVRNTDETNLLDRLSWSRVPER